MPPSPLPASSSSAAASATAVAPHDSPPPMRSSWMRGCLGCLGVLVGAFVLLLVLLYAWAGGFAAPHVGFEPSPDGRFEVVRETRSFFLDSFTRLWLTERGVRDRREWFALAPEVDGTWWADWRQANELMLTDYGAFRETRDETPVRFWRGVRIEWRRPAAPRRLEAPDARHELTVWTQRDSYGQRQSLWLQSVWSVEPKLFAELLPMGAWRVDATWLAADRVRVRIEAEAGTAVPELPARCGAIEVVVDGR